MDLGKLIVLGVGAYVAYKAHKARIEEEAVKEAVKAREESVKPEALPPEEVKYAIPLKEAEKKVMVEGIEEKHEAESLPDYVTPEEYEQLPKDVKQKYQKEGDVYVNKEKYFGAPKTTEQYEKAKSAKYYVAIDPETGGIIGTIPVDHPNAEITKQAWESAGFIVEVMSGDELMARGLTPIYG